MNATRIFPIVVLAFGLALAASAGEKVIKDGDTLVFMGDSITQYGKERTHGYPHLVVKGLAATGINVKWHGAGICGNTSADMIRRFDADALAKKPDVVTISAGVNDVWFNKVTYEQFCANMKEMVAKTKAAGAKPVLLAPTTALGEGDNPGIRKFSAGVRKLAAAEGVAYAPTFEMLRAWIDDPDTPALTLFNGISPLRATYDGVHQVPAGDRVLARATLKALGLNANELSKAEAAWNADETLVPLIAPPSSSSFLTVKLTPAEAAAVSGLSLKDVLDRGIPSLAARPVMETEAPGAAVAMTVTPGTGTFSFKAYDQLLLAARALGIRADEAVKCAILRGARDMKPLAPTAPSAAMNDVLTGATVATFDATVSSVGATASACDVFLKFGKDGKGLGEAARIAVGENGSFTFLLKGLQPGTTYLYEMAFVNNATTPQKNVVRGKFTTKAKSGAIQPSGGDDTATIQAALDAAVPSRGTVTLAEGVFSLSAELAVTGGVSLVGTDWKKTSLQQTSAHRVVTLKDGSRLEGVTVTGGKTTANWEGGVGVKVEDGTVSRCRILRNAGLGYNVFGGGVFIAKGTVEKSVIVDNVARAGGGGGIAWRYASGPVVIDSCRISGNAAPEGNGGGVAFVFGNPEVTIRNTTITDNTADKSGGGLFLDATMKKVTLVDSVILGNKAGAGDADLAGTPAAGSSGNSIGGAK